MRGRAVFFWLGQGSGGTDGVRDRGGVPDAMNSTLIHTLLAGITSSLILVHTLRMRGQVATEPVFEWASSVPELQGVASAPLEAMFARIDREQLPIDGFVLVRNGVIVAERYYGGYGPDTRHAMYSVTKSFTATALGIALDRGLVSGVEAPALSFFPGMAVQDLTPAKQRMQVRHLLTMATGHTTDTTNAVSASADWVKAFFDLPLPEEPGTRFLYNSGASVVVSGIVQATTGMTTEAFARQTFLGPMGVTNLVWEQGPHSLSIGGWGLWLTPRDMARAGLLWLNRGKWPGGRLVSASWVEASSRRQISNGTTGDWGVGYGYQFWLNPFGGFRADGYGGQLIFVLPDRNVVAVFTSRPTGAPVPVAFDLMSAYVIPAIGALDVAHIAEGVPPLVRSQPKSMAVGVGGQALFCVGAEGPELSYQWEHDGVAIAGGTGRVLRIDPVSVGDAGRYRVRISNAGGSVDSAWASLDVAEPVGRRRILALSARARAWRGERSLVIGVAVTGASGVGVPVMLRGIGPSLAAYGVDSVLADPVATLHSEGREPLRSDDWGGEPVIAGVAARLGNFALSADSRDAAAIWSLAPGLHTLVIDPLWPGDSGMVMGECYDALGAPSDASPRLAGLSARGWVGPGDDSLTGGFILSGPGPTTILVRAVGPGLVAQGIVGALADPVVTLYADGRALAVNDDWAGNGALAAAFARVGEFPLSADSGDAALLLTLDPGVYTAVVSSKGTDAGVALLEVYPVP